MNQTNHYFDPADPLHPYTHSLPASPGTLPPPNALRGEMRPAPAGLWPCEKDGAWEMQEDHRGKQGWIDGEPATVNQVGPLPAGWSDAPPAPKYTLAQVKDMKGAEIIAGANTVKAALSARFSELEEKSWPEQEAGARSLLGNEADVKDPLARGILADATATARAVARVRGLAEADNTAPETFAARIVSNAEAADAAGWGSLLEQRAMERAVNAAKTVKAVLAVEVKYSVLEHLQQ